MIYYLFITKFLYKVLNNYRINNMKASDHYSFHREGVLNEWGSSAEEGIFLLISEFL